MNPGISAQCIDKNQVRKAYTALEQHHIKVLRNSIHLNDYTPSLSLAFIQSHIT